MSAGVQTTVPLALGLLLDAAPAPANAGVSTTFPLVLGLLLESGSGSAPTVPNTVAGAATSGTTSTITWVDASSDETGFDVEIETPSGAANWTAASGATNPTAANVQTFSVTGLTAATQYRARVRAKGASADSAYAVSSAWETDNTGSGGGPYEVVIEPSAGALRFTGYAPTIDQSAPTGTTIAPSSGALRFTGYAPSIDLLAGNQTIEPTAGALRFTGYAPTVGQDAQGGGKKRKRRPVVAGSPYTHEDYMQWVVRTVAVVIASGALDG